ncbi:hypothetical protein Tco_1245335 [Tanacetum coccineum]
MEVDIEEDENEPELTYPYEEVDPLNPLPPAFESEPEDVIEVEDTVDPEDETVHASVHETIVSLVEKKGKAKDKYYGKLILDLSNDVQSSVEEGTAAMKNLVRKLGNTKEKAECKKLKKELKEARLSNTSSIMPPKSAPLTQAVVRRMIKESVDAAIAAERVRHENTRNDARGSRPVRVLKELSNYEDSLRRLRVFLESVNVQRARRFNELALMCQRMVEPKSVKIDAYIRGLSENIKGEVTSSKPTNLNKVVRMAHKLMEQKSQASDERILEGKKRK